MQFNGTSTDGTYFQILQDPERSELWQIMPKLLFICHDWARTCFHSPQQKMSLWHLSWDVGVESNALLYIMKMIITIFLFFALTGIHTIEEDRGILIAHATRECILYFDNGRWFLIRFVKQECLHSLINSTPPPPYGLVVVYAFLSLRRRTALKFV